MLFSVADNQDVWGYDAQTGSLTEKIGNQTEPVYLIEVSPDGSKLAAISSKKVRIWNLPSLQPS